jgi:hypothetical protein
LYRPTYRKEAGVLSDCQRENIIGAFATGEGCATQEEAEIACDAVPDEHERKKCIFDIVTTNHTLFYDPNQCPEEGSSSG